MLGGEPPPPGQNPDQGMPPDAGAPPTPEPPQGNPPQGGGSITVFPEPSDEDIHKYDMDIHDFASEQDHEEVDYSEE
jgi:hypothetical protein